MVQYDGRVYAIIVYASHDQEGIEFFTDPSDGLQLGYMKRRKGYEVEPHVHIPVRRTVDYTNEVLFIRSGEVLIQFYTANKQTASKTLIAPPVLVFASANTFQQVAQTTSNTTTQTNFFDNTIDTEVVIQCSNESGASNPCDPNAETPAGITSLAKALTQTTNLPPYE